MNYLEYIQNNITRQEISYRGGGVEIELNDLLPETYQHEGESQLLLSAYQNYLGGGMTGSIQSDQNFMWDDMPQAEAELLADVTEALKLYFYNVQNDNDLYADEWSRPQDFEAQQSRPTSAY